MERNCKNCRYDSITYLQYPCSKCCNSQNHKELKFWEAKPKYAEAEKTLMEATENDE